MSENIGNKIEQSNGVFKPEVKSDQVLENIAETVIEQASLEKKVEQEGTSKPEIKEPAAITVSNHSSITDDYHKRREIEIDSCLSDGLSETFLAMSPSQQKVFKEEGELAAKKINVLLDEAKINIGKIVSIIKKWLKLITGINRFFLDQEAKIKADKVVKLKNKL